MTAMNPLRNILNDTPATAIDIDWNFQAVEDYVATDVVKRDGSVAMEAPLSLLGAPPTQAAHATPKSYVDALLPVGMLMAFAGTTAPAGWALCDGAPKTTTDPAYVALFAVIQYTYGGSGGTFNLPDTRGKVAVGRSAGDAQFGTLGASGGNRNAIVPTHTHGLNNHVHTMGSHEHITPAHQHYIDSVNRSVGGGYGSNGNPSGWAVDTGASGIIFGEAGQVADLSGNTRPFSGSPPNWFQQTLGVDVGGMWTRVGDGAIWTSGNSATSNTTYGASGNTADANGAAATANANLQPYIVVNHIIRIG